MAGLAQIIDLKPGGLSGRNIGVPMLPHPDFKLPVQHRQRDGAAFG